jgi:hypothetical protein
MGRRMCDFAAHLRDQVKTPFILLSLQADPMTPKQTVAGWPLKAGVLMAQQRLGEK